MGNCTSVVSVEVPRVKYDTLTPEIQEKIVAGIVTMIKDAKAQDDPIGFHIPLTTTLPEGAVSNPQPLLKAMQLLEITRPYTIVQGFNKLSVTFVQNLTPKNFVVV